MIDTETLKAYRRELDGCKDLNIETERVARLEFPIGSKVRWVHTYSNKPPYDPVWREGVVKAHGPYRWKIQFKTGTLYDKYSHDLQPIPEATLEKSATKSVIQLCRCGHEIAAHDQHGFCFHCICNLKTTSEKSATKWAGL